MLGLQTRVVLVDPLRFDDGVPKRLEQRDASVLVGVGDVFGQRVDEKLREMRFIALERALSRRDDDPVRSRQHRQHVAARARHVDERDLLCREVPKQLREIARAQVGTGNADLGLRPLAAAVPDEHDRHLIARADASRHLR